MTKLCITVRWYGGSDSDFYPWLEQQLAPVDVAHAVLGPTREAPTIDASVSAIEAAVAKLGKPEEIVFLAHSAGCRALLRYLEALPEGARVGGVVLVAAWTTLDKPWPEIQPWVDVTHDWNRVKDRCDRFTVLLSDDDPFTSDHEANAAVWKKHLGVDARVLPGRKHYNRPEEPDVLEAVRAMRA